MLSNNLNAMLKPYKGLANKHALSVTYRVLELSKGRIVGCSPSAILETSCDHGIIEPVYVTAATFVAVVDSLPTGKEVVFDVKDNVVSWSCGSAKGKLATMTVDNMPAIGTTKRKSKNTYNVTSAFAKGLQLGAVSCNSEGLQSMGLYGVVVDNGVEPMAIFSSDNATISCAYIEEPCPLVGKLTLSPDAALLLADLIQPGDGTIDFGDNEVLYQDKYCRCMIKGVPDLQYDSMDQIIRLDTADIVAPIPPDAVGSFLKRATALAESRRHTYVFLSATKGQIALAFEEGTASAEEYYVCEKLDVPDLPPIKLDAMKLSRALANCNEISLDHLDTPIIVLRGKELNFRYIIGGRVDTPQ